MNTTTKGDLLVPFTKICPARAEIPNFGVHCIIRIYTVYHTYYNNIIIRYIIYGSGGPKSYIRTALHMS
jgi:hypothetical protein